LASIQTFKKRLSMVYEELEKRGVKAAIVFNTLNMYYLTGFPRGRSLIVPVGGEPILLVSELEFDEATETVKYGVVLPLKANMSLYEVIISKLTELNINGNIAVERQYMNIDMYSTLAKKLNVSEFIDFSTVILQIRSVKDSEEIDLIRKALNISEKSIKHLLGILHEGLSEVEIAGEIEYAMRKAGSEGYAFDSIVASGVRSAYPHASTTQKRVCQGELVVIDVGAKYGGYCSDITRTIAIGSIHEDLKKMFIPVLEAIDAAVDVLSAGVTGAEVDAVARRVIEKYGYGKYFTHSLGHGVGLAVHEEPGLNSRNNSPLLSGSVVTIEPGIYIKGVGGVRIEEMALVRDDGCEILNKLERVFF